MRVTITMIAAGMSISSSCTLSKSYKSFLTLLSRWGPFAGGDERAVPGHMLGLTEKADMPTFACGKRAFAPVPQPANIVWDALQGRPSPADTCVRARGGGKAQFGD